MTAPTDFIAKLGKAPKNFTARYYGTRTLEVFPAAFLARVRECNKFIDITAGGGRFTYDQAKLQKTIGANDRCFYSYCALFSVLVSQTFGGDWFNVLWDKTHPSCTTQHPGYFTQLQKTPVSDSVRSYIDCICTMFNNDPFVLYCFGKAIRSIFTYRGLSWCPATPFGIPSNEVTPEYIHRFAMKAAWMTSLHNLQVRNKVNQVFCYDATVALEEFNRDVIEGALVYADPAWPWAGKNNSNPYKWVSEDLSSILAQTNIKIEFWPKDEFKILTDVGHWIRVASQRGAKYFVVCNQDTNFPPLEHTRAYLNSLTVAKLIKWIEVEDKSKAAHKSYKTAWGILEC